MTIFPIHAAQSAVLLAMVLGQNQAFAMGESGGAPASTVAQAGRAEEDDSDEDEWPAQHSEDSTPFHATMALRGVTSEAGEFAERFTFEGGITLPVLRGVDIGLQAGAVFKENARVNLAMNARIYLFDELAGTYLGGGTIFQGKTLPYGTLGWGGSGFFFEMDFRESTRQPIAVIPEFGLRVRF